MGCCTSKVKKPRSSQKDSMPKSLFDTPNGDGIMKDNPDINRKRAFQDKLAEKNDDKN